MKAVRRVTLWTIAAVLQITLAYGQATTATIRGRVVDPQGRPVASATVTVRRQDNAISRTVSTAADGTFEVSNVPPSAVDLVVTAPGFTESKRTGLVLEVGRTTTVDVDLKVGGVRETVDVGVTASAVDTTHSVVDAVTAVDRHRGAAAERPQLSRAGPPRSRQRARAQLRPDQVEQRPHLLRRSARPRRQHHDRRRRQQRRRGRRPAAERHAGVGAGIPDRDEPVLGRIRTLRFVGHQRRDQVRHRSAPRIGGVVRA